MKLSEFAKRSGLSYQTAWNLFKAGKLPVKAVQLSTGTIIVDELDFNQPKVYCSRCKEILEKGEK